MDVNTKNISTAIRYGKIISVRGSVVDVAFDNDLPPIYTLLRSGKEKQISIEVLSQLDNRSVRGIALNPTQGLARGMVVETDGKELTVPVGKNIMGRMFDVFGNTIDHLDPLPPGKRRNIHQSPPPLSKRAVKSEIFETGIKAIDVLIPLERGGKAGL
ncbi:MAG: F0F1 ATP synthase subunit beta, partial [Ginsengibacter sp.]